LNKPKRLTVKASSLLAQAGDWHYTMSMTQLPQLNRLPIKGWFVALLCLAAALAGCGQNDIRVYTVPKEKPSVATASVDAAAQPQVHWKLPSGWEEQEAGGMRLARFAVTGKDGHQADVAIIPLGAVNAPIDQLVNIWREQIHLPAVKPEELANQGEKIKIGASQGNLFELVSTEAMIGMKMQWST